MQEKLARLHFSLDSHVEELSEDQRKCASDHNLEHLLCNVRTNQAKQSQAVLCCSCTSSVFLLLNCTITLECYCSVSSHSWRSSALPCILWTSVISASSSEPLLKLNLPLHESLTCLYPDRSSTWLRTKTCQRHLVPDSARSGGWRLHTHLFQTSLPRWLSERSASCLSDRMERAHWRRGHFFFFLTQRQWLKAVELSWHKI